MMRPRVLVLPVLAVLAAATSRPICAQTSIGGFVGHEFDETLSAGWLFGADARMAIPNSPAIVQVQVGEHPGSGGGPSILQIDANVLYDFKLADPGLILPYLGVGVGFVHAGNLCGDFGGDDCSLNKPVANFVAGFRLGLKGDPAVVPFVHTVYSFARNYGNTYHLEFGAIYTLGKK